MGTPDSIFVVLILLNLYLLSVSRLEATINAVAIQGVLLGILPAILVVQPSIEVIVTGFLAIVVKGFIFPILLRRAMREARVRKEVDSSTGFIVSLILGASGTCAAVSLAAGLPLLDQFAHSLLIPTAFSIILTGFLLLTTRRRAITQVVGFLVLGNGIFLFGLTLINAIPSLVDIGMLFDLCVWVFVIGVILNQVQRTFSSLDTNRMTVLRH